MSSMNSRSGISYLLASVLFVGQMLSSARAQPPKEKWQRVYTGEDSIIELNTAGTSFEPGRVLRAEIRTTFSKPQKLSSTSTEKYKTRLETIDFKLNEKRYRLFETTALDTDGRTVSSYKATDAAEWRAIRTGGVTDRLFNILRALPPFGNWKAVSYRLAEAGTSTRELDDLIGTAVRLSSDQAAVGTKVCLLPAYEHKQGTKEEVARELGIKFDTIGVNADYLASITVKCSGVGWRPPQSLLIRVSNTDEMLMLWNGVFLVLKKDRQGSSSFPLVLKRREP